MTLPAGGWFEGLNQAPSGLSAAALEPDSPNSFVANHVLDLDNKALLRILAKVD